MNQSQVESVSQPEPIEWRPHPGLRHTPTISDQGVVETARDIRLGPFSLCFVESAEPIELVLNAFGNFFWPLTEVYFGPT